MRLKWSERLDFLRVEWWSKIRFSAQYARARETTLFNSVRKIRIISPGNYATLRKWTFCTSYKKQNLPSTRTRDSKYKKVFIKLKSFWTWPKLKHLFYEHLKNYWTGAFINGRLWTGARISYNHKNCSFCSFWASAPTLARIDNYARVYLSAFEQYHAFLYFGISYCFIAKT